jgi:AcrR family transcriptional regulator
VQASFHPPRQQRSAATLDRIVRAAQDLLAQRGYDAVTVDDIVARAGSSKGSFYHRFADKEALLAYLAGECLARGKATWAERLDPRRLRGVPLPAVLDEFVRDLMADYRGSDGPVLRALITEAWLRPDSEFQRMTDELDAHVRDALERLLRARSAEFSHPSPRRAARFGMLMLDATVREAVLFATDRGGPLGVPDAQLRRELADAYAAYLGVDRAARRP